MSRREDPVEVPVDHEGRNCDTCEVLHRRPLEPEGCFLVPSDRIGPAWGSQLGCGNLTHGPRSISGAGIAHGSNQFGHRIVAFECGEQVVAHAR